MSGELKWSIVTLLLTVLSFVVPGGRVLTVPFAFALILILLFWGARVSAEREES
jgi:hypothetical protein